jgi:pimeloyl-ACP methyl ester carboxylesterase
MRRSVSLCHPVFASWMFAVLAACTPIAGDVLAANSDPVPKSLRVGQDTYAYLKQGKGPALVIVHGVGGHKEDWKGVMSALSKAHTVYAVDMLGFGGSSREAVDLSIPRQAAAIKALLDNEKVKKADLIGNSVGGWVAATFASQYPTSVNKLVLVDPAGFEAMFKGESPVNLFPDDVGQMKKLLSFVIHSDFAQTDEFAQKASGAFQASGEKTIEPRFFPALAGSPKLEDVMPKIKAQTLVVWCKEDKLFPVALAPYITGLTPGAKSTIIDNASHFPQIDQPKKFIEIVRVFFNGTLI